MTVPDYVLCFAPGAVVPLPWWSMLQGNYFQEPGQRRGWCPESVISNSQMQNHKSLVLHAHAVHQPFGIHTPSSVRTLNWFNDDFMLDECVSRMEYYCLCTMKIIMYTPNKPLHLYGSKPLSQQDTQERKKKEMVCPSSIPMFLYQICKSFLLFASPHFDLSSHSESLTRGSYDLHSLGLYLDRTPKSYFLLPASQ